ncbi:MULTISPECIES: Fe(3+)-hydroxamate ABC transporter permease FhuB [unclassified Brenneria]|uniref:Fe(3+)-hydroxamate ABC transporter permease FhuB n=1 Tax=unclassified Brenneria TaxID=2634434 RepID=UPI0015530491|nr:MULTISPECIES: Fe(3+)-hydroxamate ABC transporter permease FhuB [unclassified Brenneria]MBJ7223252.1 Fe(3+)-hydroxamate ABC transporter permease FhuB [Brenneria sp. L3-3C-1]MEE3644492.1 Fe(3+)-hydroxamate ABC transporter permease FhuB [Brenneria sp. L3_3C_1]MEE3652054.1 Fe(3+)-hydroxamate ABC transporter permease FhuB [Brenneria sp. HEZEL_4_2_4]NPD02014.1 Fe(3+)-hydroxamate ABC transporter permease FhuB [Brenneria sp. hezel4-2-4]
MSVKHRMLPILLIGLLLALTLGMGGYNLQRQLPVALWSQGLWQPSTDDIRQLLFHYSLLPRMALALLVGAGLGLCGVLFQQVLRNPLAESSTLGIATGAQLGITVATLAALPGGAFIQQIAAMIGALLVGALVFGVAWGKRLSPVTLILAGLVLSFYCGAVNQLLALFHHDQLQNMFLWSSGALNQQDWRNVWFVLPRLLACFCLALLLLRPLTLLGLDDGVARNLGLGLSLARLGALGLAVFLSAQLVNATGIIGFIGLFAPLLAKMLGARRLLHRLWLAPLLGALLLGVTDQIVIWLTGVWREVPTGAATALIGAPLLLWLLPRLRASGPASMTDRAGAQTTERRQWGLWLLGGSLLLAAVVLTALLLGKNAQGWQWSSGDLSTQLLPWRWPRVLAALTAGVMLAVAGTLIQKLTGNPMGSPEVLGISSGASFGVILLMFLVPGNAFVWLIPAGSAGAAATLLTIVIVAGRGGFSTQRMLLAGIALSTAFTTVITLLLASGDPRMGSVLTWLSGSTYAVEATDALRTAVIAALLLLMVPLCQRWLRILPLGAATARGLGMAVTPVRLLVLLLASVLTAMATLMVGPMSFVGLMAPHLARLMGFSRVMPQLCCSALIGGLLMVLADWCGRMMLFPNQIPAGLLATFIGAPYFVYLLRKQVR